MTSYGYGICDPNWGAKTPEQQDLDEWQRRFDRWCRVQGILRESTS
jgi:hypothetical protein